MKAREATTRSRRGAAIALTVIVSAALLAACSTAPPTPLTPTPTAAPAPKPAPKPAPEPIEPPWQRFSDPRTPGSFDVPPGWSVIEPGTSEPEYEIFQFVLLDEAGQPQLTYARKVMGLGGDCGYDASYDLVTTDLDTEPVQIEGYVPEEASMLPLSAPEFSYRAVENVREPGVFATIALSDTAPGEGCFYYNLLHTASALVRFADTLQVSVSDAVKHFDTLAEARAYMDTDEYQLVKRVLLSFRLDG